jgi:hypothetical protein
MINRGRLTRNTLTVIRHFSITYDCIIATVTARTLSLIIAGIPCWTSNVVATVGVSTSRGTFATFLRT